MSEESAAPEAQWAPPDAPATPQRPRGRAAAWIVVLGTVAAGVGLVALADQPPSSAPRNTAEQYLPPDGSAREVSYADGARWTVESSFSTGVGLLLQQPLHSGNHQLARLEASGSDPGQVRLWRQLWTDNVEDRGQLTELYELGDDGVRLLTVTGGTVGFSFNPGVLTLPADIAPGSTWSGEGDAWPEGIYRYAMTGSAEAGDDGCLVVSMDISYTDPAADNAEILHNTETSTWCPGRGAVSASFTNVGSETVTGATTAEPLPVDTALDANTQAARIDLSDRDVWTVEDVPLHVRDPIFGESILTGTTDGRAVTTASGVAVFNTGQDLVAYRIGDDVERSWIAHPGGETVSLVALGDVVLVSTTDRVLQSYDSLGRRGWRAQFADAVLAAPVSDGSGGVLVMSLDGDLRRLDLLTGEAKWARNVGGDSDVSPAVADGRVFTVDRSDTLRTFNRATGEPLWSQPVEGGMLIAADDERVFVVNTKGSVLAWDAETGEPLWERAYYGTPASMTVVGQTLVVQSSDGTVGYSMSGERLWSTPATEGLVTDGTSLAVLTESDVVVLDEDGEELGRWPVGDMSLGVTHRLIPAPGGLWVIKGDFTVKGVWVR